MGTVGLKQWVLVAASEATSQCEYLRDAVLLAKDSSFKSQLTFVVVIYSPQSLCAH